MLPLADYDALRSVSHRAQMAYALACIESAVRAYDLRGSAFDEWAERAWRRTSAPKMAWREAAWPRNFAEIDALLDPPVGGWGEGVADILRKLFELASNTCEDILDGRGGAEPVRALVGELSKHGIEPPPIAPYLRSPSSEMGGLGRSVPPGFFRSGLEREDFALHLVQGLRSDSVLRRREAAHAAAHLGIGSETLGEALAACLEDHDGELERLVEAALLEIGSREQVSTVVWRQEDAIASKRVSEQLQSAAAATRDTSFEVGGLRAENEAFEEHVRRLPPPPPVPRTLAFALLFALLWLAFSGVRIVRLAIEAP